MPSSVIEGMHDESARFSTYRRCFKSSGTDRRQLLLKAYEISCETLRLFCTHYNERLPLGGLTGARISILIATAVKAINTSHAVCRLCVERPYFEGNERGHQESNRLDRQWRVHSVRD